MSSSADTSGTASADTSGTAGAADTAVPETAEHDPDGWEAFAERPAPGAMDPPSPDREVARAVQQLRKVLDASRRQTDDQLSAVREVVADLARQAWRLDALLLEAAGPLREAGKGNLHKRLDVVRKEIRDRLADLDIEAEDPTGRPFDAVADVVDVLRWRHEPGFTTEEVAETYEPIVRDGSVVVRYGQVVVGAPPATGDDEDGAAPDGDRSAEHDTTPDEAHQVRAEDRPEA
ncbi:hypothetical protein [Streptomyces sp. TS71-3]|uniref:hypothetical protein n=1 Tax=Streptomyces sp. TS71-3 TaxID=2733862 RepID=UPI001B0CEA49|nr:hypothetical protein [Streptomyces sp. TS71-3]GHJ42010.1 hypothetical protein Sm713_76190 [Streptomyces sp. TS71-3]